MTGTALPTALQQSFDLRLARYGDELRHGLHTCYGKQAETTFAKVLEIVAKTMATRSPELRRLDEQRLLSPDWLQNQHQVAYETYPDTLAGNLLGVCEKLDYLNLIGITHLHLLAVLNTNDADQTEFRGARVGHHEIRPDLGTIDDLVSLASALHAREMSLEIDINLNHVVVTHPWAQLAQQGHEHYRRFFHVYSDRYVPDEWENTLTNESANQHGIFTRNEELGGWVWTTFGPEQWDLNWSNPQVFIEFVEILCQLANDGIDVFCLNDISYTWKRLGTDCCNQPEVHYLIQALRAALRIAAPAVAFKANAIGSPNQLTAYLGTGIHTGKISDCVTHETLNTQLWSALATKDTRLLSHTLTKFPHKPFGTTWVNYVRNSADITWDDLTRFIAEIDQDPHAHQEFLAAFYSGNFPASFARGVFSDAATATHSHRISGTTASLAGLEAALDRSDETAIDLAIKRIVLLYAAIIGFGGIPQLYQGDELGMLNDYSYTSDPEHDGDAVWVHRGELDSDLAIDTLEEVETAIQTGQHPTSVAARIFYALAHLIAVRKTLPQLHACVESEVLTDLDPRLLVVVRPAAVSTMVQVLNFSGDEVVVDPKFLGDYLGETAREALTGYTWSFGVDEITIMPYEALWFVGHT